MSLFKGEESVGHTFSKHHPTFEQDYVKPFTGFLKHIYPHLVRQTHSLPAKDGTEINHEEIGTMSIIPNPAARHLSPSVPGIVSTIPTIPTSDTSGSDKDSTPMNVAAENLGSTSTADPVQAENLHGNTLSSNSVNHHNSMAQDNHGWLDPSLRAPSTITNDAMHIVDKSHGQLDDESDNDDGDNDMQLTNSGFPDHPLQSWEMYPSATSSHAEPVENLEQSKRQRRPVASKEVMPIMARDKSWLCHSHAFLSESDYGSIWSDSVNLWWDFEQGLPLADLSSARLPAIKARPRELAQWLTKRDFSNPPAIHDVTRYAKDLITWWSDMQASTKKKTQPFEHLRKGGPNGLVTLLLGLKLWWMNVGMEGKAEWDTVMKEVDVMVKSFHDNSVKRKEPPVQSAGTQKRRKQGDA